MLECVVEGSCQEKNDYEKTLKTMRANACWQARAPMLAETDVVQ